MLSRMLLHMTNIVIIGDSWGVPNHGGPPGAPADSHTEILLRNLGYNLINFSENGDSNDNALTRAHNYVNQGNPVDWIIWFHSEMIRERHLFNPYEPYRINEAIQQISEYVYRKFEALRVKTQAKTIVIGSQAPVLDTFSEYAFSDYIIKDWRSDICGRQLPMVQSLGQIDLVESTANLATLEEKLDLLTKHKIILDAMKESSDFPDGAHPGIDPHKKLTQYIDNLIKPS